MVDRGSTAVDSAVDRVDRVDRVDSQGSNRWIMYQAYQAYARERAGGAAQKLWASSAAGRP